jgi:predicted component of type VI protein secretion system
MSATKYILTVRTGPHEGMVFELDKETMILGRDETNDIVLPDAEVSRKHSRLTYSPQGYVLEDLGSTNGTFVNAERLSGPHLLIPGDQIGLSQKLVISIELAEVDSSATLVVKPLVETPAAKIEESSPEIKAFVARIEESAAEVEAPVAQVEAPVAQVEAPAAKVEAPAAEDVAAKREEFEVVKEAAPERKKRINRWMIAGIGCAALIIVFGGIFWFLDSRYPEILYAPLYALMELLGFQ